MSFWTYATLHFIITLGINLCWSQNDSGITIENFKVFGNANISAVLPLGEQYFQYLKLYAKSRLHCLMACAHYQSCLSAIFDTEGRECELVYGTGPVDSTVLRVSSLMYTKLSRLQDDIITNAATPTLPNTNAVPGTSNFTIVRPECRSYTSVASIKLNQFSIPLKVRCSSRGFEIQSNDDSSTDFFNQKISHFQSGIGNVNNVWEKYMMGLDDIYLLTSSIAFSLVIKPMNNDIFRLFDFQMANSSMNYRITFSRCSLVQNECKQVMLNLNGTMFSTLDADHDGNSNKNCAYESGAGFWYSADCNYWVSHWVEHYLATKYISSMLLIYQ